MKNTKLLQEAIIEARELKEVAEKSVKQQLMEELSPLIKKTMETHFSSMLKEQDASLGIEEEPDGMNGEQEFGNMPVSPVTGGLEVTDNVVGQEEPPAVGTEPSATTPIAPTDASDEHSVNIPLPDVNGMITVSIEDLFTKPGGVISAVDALNANPVEPEQTPGENPNQEPVAQETPIPDAQGMPGDDLAVPVPLAESVRHKFLKLVDSLVEGETKIQKLTPTLAENITLGFIALVEEGQELLENGLIESTDLVLCKKRAQKVRNNLQEKLNSVFEQNSYNEESNQKTDGEQMAIKKTLKDLFEETEITFDGLDTEKAKKEAEAKQKKLNGQDPGQNPGNAVDGKSKDGEWDIEGAAAAASNTETQKTALEEAIELFKAAMSLNEEDENEGSVFDAGTDDDSSTEPSEPEEHKDPEDFDIEALLRDFEAQLKDHGIDLDNLDVDISGDKDGSEFDLKFDLDDDGHVEPADADDASAHHPDEDEDAAVVIAEATKAIRQAKKVISESRREREALELYNFKTVSLNKLLMKESIKTYEDKKAAVAALDRGTTVAQVENIYNRIVAHKLQEGKVARNGKASAGTDNGTISEGVKLGGTTQINESSNPIFERMQNLAKMK